MEKYGSFLEKYGSFWKNMEALWKNMEAFFFHMEKYRTFIAADSQDAIIQNIRGSVGEFRGIENNFRFGHFTGRQLAVRWRFFYVLRI